MRLTSEIIHALVAGDWNKLSPEQWGRVRQAIGNQRLRDGDQEARRGRRQV